MAKEPIPDKDLGPLAHEAKRIEEDALYSFKGHFVASEWWKKLHYWVGIPLALATAAAGVLAFADIPYVAGSLAVACGLLGGAMTFFNPTNRATEHLVAGNGYRSLHARARRLHELDCVPSASSLGFLRKQLEEIAARQEALAAASPKISQSAYKNARKSIEFGEADYRIDATN